MENYVKRTVVTIFILVIIISTFAFLDSENVLNKSPLLNPKEYTQKDMDDFKIFYHDSYVGIFQQFIGNCSRHPVTAFNLAGFNNTNYGIMLRCERGDVNLTFPIAYSKFIVGDENEKD